MPLTEPTSKSANSQAADVGSILSRARGVIDIEIEALEALKPRIGEDFIKAVELIEACTGRVIVTGMGKSGIIGRKIAATLSSTGTPSTFLHPAEGSHGDLGVIMPNDVVIAISNSGETAEISGILPIIKRFGIPLIGMTGNMDSTLAKRSDAVLDISVSQEACGLNLAPTASTTATLAMGDALAVVLLDRKNFTEEDFAIFHPAGALGKRLLLTVSDLMHSGDTLPLIPEDTPFLQALLTISHKKLGVGIVVNAQNEMLGILTDGDIRRALTEIPTKYADVQAIPLKAAMTQTPKTITADAMAVSALRLMEEKAITALVVVENVSKSNQPAEALLAPIGLIHLHDILKTGIR